VTEFRINGKWGRVAPHHPKLIPHKINKPKANTTHQTSHETGE